MKHPVMIVPDAMKALQALAAAPKKSAVPERTLELVNLRASQINRLQRLRRHAPTPCQEGR